MWQEHCVAAAAWLLPQKGRVRHQDVRCTTRRSFAPSTTLIPQHERQCVCQCCRDTWRLASNGFGGSRVAHTCSFNKESRAVDHASIIVICQLRQLDTHVHHRRRGHARVLILNCLQQHQRRHSTARSQHLGAGVALHSPHSGTVASTQATGRCYCGADPLLRQHHHCMTRRMQHTS